MYFVIWFVISSTHIVQNTNINNCNCLNALVSHSPRSALQSKLIKCDSFLAECIHDVEWAKKASHIKWCHWQLCKTPSMTGTIFQNRVIFRQTPPPMSCGPSAGCNFMSAMSRWDFLWWSLPPSMTFTAQHRKYKGEIDLQIGPTD